MAFEDGDPLERIAASGQDSEQPDFDPEAELVLLAAQGYVFPEPVVRRALDVALVVSECGWEGAQALLDEDWVGWEADFLSEALPHVLAAWRGQERAGDRKWWRSVLGSGR